MNKKKCTSLLKIIKWQFCLQFHVEYHEKIIVALVIQTNDKLRNSHSNSKYYHFAFVSQKDHQNKLLIPNRLWILDVGGVGTWFSVVRVLYLYKRINQKNIIPIVKSNSTSFSSNNFFRMVNNKKKLIRDHRGLAVIGLWSEYISSFWCHSNTPNFTPILLLYHSNTPNFTPILLLYHRSSLLLYHSNTPNYRSVSSSLEWHWALAIKLALFISTIAP